MIVATKKRMILRIHDESVTWPLTEIDKPVGTVKNSNLRVSVCLKKINAYLFIAQIVI